MLTRPTSLPEGTQPRFRIEVYRDPNGNWFASVECWRGRGCSMSYTPTFTTPTEAIERAVFMEIAGTTSGV